MVPRNVRLSECPSFGKPILLYDIKSKGCESYLALGREIMEREPQPQPQPPPKSKAARPRA